MESENVKRSLTAWLPTYMQAQQFLRVMEGTSYSFYRAMRDAIDEQRGTPQSTVNWSNPDEWIQERLHDESQAIALRLWDVSERTVNPRDCRGLMSLGDTHRLVEYPDDIIVLTEKGKSFLAGDTETLAEMDNYEGMLLILSEVAEKSPGKRRDFKSRYAEFCRSLTTYAADSSISSSLISRLNNLVDRGLVDRNGRTYQITDLGLTYLQRVSGGGTGLEPTVELLVNKKNSMARKQLAEFLQSMDPYQFEHLIKRLLEEMGYSDVEVTAASNDKGVDVVAEIELGISHVREVIQVKRQKSNIGRPILDQLRGSLHYFQAVRGSIISTSGFAKNAQQSAFAPGAAPITLIDGDRLVNLLIEHNIGIRRREVRILEFDADSLRQFDSEEVPILPSSRQLESE